MCDRYILSTYSGVQGSYHVCIALLCLQAALLTLVVLCLLAKLPGQGFKDVCFLTLTHGSLCACRLYWSRVL